MNFVEVNGQWLVPTLQVQGGSTFGGGVTVSSGNMAVGSAGAIGWLSAGIMTSPGDSTIAMQNFAQSTYASLQALEVDFRQAASTFAQTATITNGPRAANPIAWVQVRVNGTTGRMAIW